MTEMHADCIDKKRGDTYVLPRYVRIGRDTYASAEIRTYWPRYVRIAMRVPLISPYQMRGDNPLLRYGKMYLLLWTM